MAQNTITGVHICGENGHNKRNCASSSTRKLVEKSTAFKEIVEGGSFNPIRVDVDDNDENGSHKYVVNYSTK